MQTQKRSWIYGGLAHPPGMVLARAAPRGRRLAPGATMLLTGDAHAWGLSPFLSHLCRDGEVTFIERAHRCTLEDWVDTAGLRQAVAEAKPTVVVISLGPTKPLCPASCAAIGEIAAAARHRGGTLVWLRPPQTGPLSRPFRLELSRAKVPSFHSEALRLPRGPDEKTPTARGYAGWAGALWRWIG